MKLFAKIFALALGMFLLTSFGGQPPTGNIFWQGLFAAHTLSANSLFTPGLHEVPGVTVCGKP